jgi:hypothetical protein
MWAGLNQDQRMLLFDHITIDERGAFGVHFELRLDQNAKTLDRFLVDDGQERLVVRGTYEIDGDSLLIYEVAPLADRPTREQVASKIGCTIWSFRHTRRVFVALASAAHLSQASFGLGDTFGIRVVIGHRLIHFFGLVELFELAVENASGTQAGIRGGCFVPLE